MESAAVSWAVKTTTISQSSTTAPKGKSLKSKLWDKLVEGLKTTSAMAADGWNETPPTAQGFFEVSAFLMKKRIASYKEMRDVTNPVELDVVIAASDQVANKILEIQVMVAELETLSLLAQKAEADFVATLD